MARNRDQICEEYRIISGRDPYQVYLPLGVNLVTTLSRGKAEFFRMARRKPFLKGGWTLSSCPPWKKAQQQRQMEKLSVSLTQRDLAARGKLRVRSGRARGKQKG